MNEIDVLAVMDRIIPMIRVGFHTDHPRDLAEARDAVAELIEASEALAELWDASMLPQGNARKRLEKAIERAGGNA